MGLGMSGTQDNAQLYSQVSVLPVLLPLMAPGSTNPQLFTGSHGCLLVAQSGTAGKPQSNLLFLVIRFSSHPSHHH